MAIVLALITSIGHALDSFFVRKGLIETPFPMAAAFITLSVNFAFFAVLSLILLPGHLLKFESIYVFIIAGLLAPALGRALNYTGLHRLGMSITSPIVNTDSLFATGMALIFLKEPLSFPLALGICGIVVGVLLLGYESGQGKGIVTHRGFRYRYILFPLTAAMCFGLSIFLRKLGLQMVNSPILGAAVTSATSWCIFTVYVATSGNMGGMGLVRRGSLIYFLIAGGMNCVTWLAYFHALNMGRVSVVSPIAGCYSIFTLLLSGTLLRKAERINMRIILATFLVAAGVITLSLAK